MKQKSQNTLEATKDKADQREKALLLLADIIAEYHYQHTKKTSKDPKRTHQRKNGGKANETR